MAPPEGPRRDQIDVAIDVAFDRGWDAGLRDLELRLHERAGNQTIKQVIRMIAEMKRGMGNG